jgi:hypothetical protein
MAEQSNERDKLVILTERILSELELLTSSIKAQALIRFQSDFLNTNQKRGIYETVDGEKDSQALANANGCSLRAAQLLIKELQDNDLIIIQKQGNANIPAKSTSKIATYYARLDIINAGGKKDE